MGSKVGLSVARALLFSVQDLEVVWTWNTGRQDARVGPEAKKLFEEAKEMLASWRRMWFDVFESCQETGVSGGG